MVEGYTDVIALAPGRGRERGRHLRHGAGRGRTSGCCPGSRSGRCSRSTPTRPARGPPSGRSRSRSGTRCRPVVMIMPRGPGSGRLRARSTAPTPCARPPARAGRSSSTCCGARSARHDCRRSRARRAAVADGPADPRAAHGPGAAQRVRTPARRPRGRRRVTRSCAATGPARRRGPAGRGRARRSKRGTAQERVEREMLKILVRDADIYARARTAKLTEDHFRSTGGARMPSSAIRDAGRRRGSARRRRRREAGRHGVGARGGAARRASRRSTTPTHVWTRLQEFLLKGRSDGAAHAAAEAQPHDRAGVRRPVQRARHDRRRAAAPARTGRPTPHDVASRQRRVDAPLRFRTLPRHRSPARTRSSL